MKFTLTYKNKDLHQATLDIITHNDVSVTRVIEGTENPFLLSFKSDKSDKSGHILSSSAEINIYETDDFNIDNLKTSSETDIKVEFRIGDMLIWTGFVLPDFFSKEIGENAVVSMTASDRIGTLKSATLDLSQDKIKIRDLAAACLAKTGLSLENYFQSSLSVDGINYFDTYVYTERFKDVGSGAISCYDILYSILVETNSLLTQSYGKWYIVNKLDLENEMALPAAQYVNFDSVTVGAIRTIIPVASEVGIYHEFGGSLKKPANYDFSKWTGDYPDSWTRVNGFVCTKNTKEVTGYDASHNPIYGQDLLLSNLHIYNNLSTTLSSYLNNTAASLRSQSVRYIRQPDEKITVRADFNVTARVGTTITVMVTAMYLGEILHALNVDGNFTTTISDKTFLKAIVGGDNQNAAGTINFSFEGLFDNEGITEMDFAIVIFGTTDEHIFVNKAELSFKKEGDQPKGNIYKTTQGENFTRKHDIETSIFGDHITSGLNGYFYDFPKDDASLHAKSDGTLITKWTRSGETMPIGQHTARQMARMFSKAHDLLRCEIDTTSLDPLAVYRDCELNKYVIVNAEFDFLRSTANVEIEECVYDTAILKRDFIYSYFGDSTENIKSVGSISTSGISGSSGGTTHTHENKDVIDVLTQGHINVLNKLSLDAQGNVKVDATLWATGELSAYGIGSGGSSGGGGYDRLDTWADYDSSKAGWVLSALLGVDLNNRLSNVEGGSATSVSVTGNGDVIVGGSKSGNVITLTKGNQTWANLSGKPSTFTPSAHTHQSSDITSGILNIARIPTGTTDTTVALGNHLHTGVYEPVFTKNTAFNKNFGTTAGTVAEGNDSRIINGQTAYGWGNHASAGYAPNTALTAHTENTTVHITASERTNWNTAFTNNHTHSNKTVIDGITSALVSNWNTAYTNNHTHSNKTVIDGITSALVSNWNTAYTNNHTHSNKTVLDGITSTLISNWNTAFSNTHTHSNKAQLDLITQSNIDVLAKLSIVNGNLQIDGNAYATGELSAYGLGSGGSGGGSYDRLDTWADYSSDKSGWVLSALLGNDLNTRVTNLESGSATNISVTGVGNAITNVTKSGNSLIFAKDLTFSLSTHNHSGTYQPLDADLTSIAGLADASTGFLKKTAANTWALDTTVWTSVNDGAGSGLSADIVQSGFIGDLNAAWTERGSSIYNGFYVFNYSVYAVNKPISIDNANWLINIYSHGSGGIASYGHQIAAGDSQDIYFRKVTNGIFDSWSKFWHSGNDGSGSGLDADLLDGKHGYQYRGELDLGSLIDYEQVVIALVNLDNSNIERNEWAYGQMTNKRSNGVSWNGGVTNFAVQKKYNSTSMDGYLDTTASGIQLCTFTYNGTKYGGIRYYPAPTVSYGNNFMYYRGEGITPFMVKYRNNSGVLNAEVDSSLVIEGADISIKRLRTGSNIYAFTSDNVASATKLQTARTIAGVSFDGTSNIEIPFSNLSSKPTTLEGYGITNAYTNTEVDTALALKLNKSVFDDLFEKVEVSTGVYAIKAKYSFYSTGEVSAYGIGSGGGGGGTSYDRLDVWADYDSTKSGWVLSALLGNDLNIRVGNLEGGSALTVNTTGTGNAVTSITKAGTVITVTKGATFSLDNHLHTGVYEPVFTKNTAFNKDFGTTAGTVAQGNDSRIINGQTAFGWGNHASAGYAPNTALTAHTENTTVHITASERTKWDGVVTYFATHIANTSNPHSVTKAQVGLGNVDNTPDSEKNVLSATKLQTARTIAGVSFDGTANIAIPFANLSSKPTTLGGYGITDAVTINTAQTITGAKTFDANITLGVNRYIQGTDNYTGVWNVDNKLWRFGSSSSGSVSNIRSEKVGVGTDSPSEKLHVVGNILATGTVTAPIFVGALNGNAATATKLQTARTIWGQSFNGEANVSGAMTGVTSLSMTGALSGATTIEASISVAAPKVIFNAAGWSMEQVGSELQMKHNNVLKMRFTSTGSIIATEEITAFG